MGRATLSVVLASFAQAEIAVHGQAYLASGVVLLAIVLPPADRAQPQRAGGLQRLAAAAWAAKTSLQYIPQVIWTRREAGKFT